MRSLHKGCGKPLLSMRYPEVSGCGRRNRTRGRWCTGQYHRTFISSVLFICSFKDGARTFALPCYVHMAIISLRTCNICVWTVKAAGIIDHRALLSNFLLLRFYRFAVSQCRYGDNFTSGSFSGQNMRKIFDALTVEPIFPTEIGVPLVVKIDRPREKYDWV